MCKICKSSKVHPEEYTNVSINTGAKLDGRDGCIAYCCITCVVCFILMPVCGLICGPIIYYIRVITGDITTPSPTSYPTLQPIQPTHSIDLNYIKLLTNWTNSSQEFY